MTTYIDFTPSATSAFQTQVQLDGSTYTLIVTWNFFGQRYYINIYTLSGTLVLCRPLTGSPPTTSPVSFNLNLVEGVFTASTLIWRPANQQFEVTP